MRGPALFSVIGRRLDCPLYPVGMAGRIGERVKIIATVGPASLAPGVLARLIRGGVDAIRVNASHIQPAEVAPLVRKIRAAGREAGHDVAIMLDLQGPKRRIGELPEPLHLVEGSTVLLSERKTPGAILAPLRGAARHLRPGTDLFLQDGFIRLRVMSRGAGGVRCRVLLGGRLRSRAGFNIPGAAVPARVPTTRDLAYLKAGVAVGVDLVALSFVRTPGDIRRCRRHAGGIPIVAKIERPEAVEAIDAVTAASEGILVARGDLAVEMQPEQLPVLQKRLVAAANRARKPVIVATEMLASMVHAPRPTRAELTDVGNAVLDGADAVMLTDETAIGVNPVRVVNVMRRIIQAVEASLLAHDLDLRQARGSAANRPDWALADAAVDTAFEIGASAIVAVTGSGRTALLVSSRRPSVPLFAFTPSPTVRRRVALMWGVTAQPVRSLRDPDRLIQHVLERLRTARRIKAGEQVVFVFGAPLWAKGTRTNTVRVAKG